jgi:hypothetical protein
MFEGAEASKAWVDMVGALWPAGAIMVGLLWAIGMASLRFLRGLPDFSDRPELIRGAKWFWLWMSGSVFIPWVLSSVAMFLTPVPCSGSFLCFGLVFLLHTLGDRALPGLTDGGLAIMSALGPDLRRLGFEEWLDKRERTRAKQERAMRVLRVVQAGVLVAFVGATVWAYLAVDSRWIIPMWRDQRFSQAITRDLASPQVTDVLAMGSAFEGPIYPMVVHVRPDTTTERAAQVAEGIRQVLMTKRERLLWRISVRPGRGHTLARTYYVPEGMTLPANADRMLPQPRR